MPEITVCKDGDDLASRAAALIVQIANMAVQERGRFDIALAGGSTPEKTYALLAQPERVSQVAWEKIYIFFGDERFVPPTAPESNYGMAARVLLGAVPTPANHVFPVATNTRSAVEASALYAETISRALHAPIEGAPPPLDLILLGLGEDGHTASLFPQMPTLAEQKRWVVASPPGILPPPVDRITFTFPMINAARNVVFLVSGEKKAEVLKDVLENRPSVEDRPSVGVHPQNGTLTWLVDEAAAKNLKGYRG